MSDNDKIVISVDKDLKEIMPMFLENRNKDISLLKTAISSKDFAQITVIGHKLAGNAGSYGFPDLGDIGVAIESAAISKLGDEILKLIDSYEFYLSNLVVEYK